ncbi:3'(2'),5'-bisphosphate nucleotidase CysQ [Nitrosarchaeum sp.]|uniref:3'(2'),5'-bisphosphate nucleotidase CysQ family protein n=1 Tax=Nitrosarchaeum sp. TaxID=2026886 RepID=UPI00247CA30C|nr:3'(2'),5'-bisphosphate nucleotidase CysQ [Nitrosarchaeum sp.]MCV0411905.1 3'(2'),5'-bisphosphate nucleotidase CysQ [Nitrosarchaeum sp.]
MEKPFEFSKHIEIAIDSIILAGRKIMEIYDSDFKTSYKKDEEPITRADIASNEIILEYLSKTGIQVLSEESNDDKSRIKENSIWIIDPLDGTADFINKTGEFTVMIALIENKIPTVGIVYWPENRILFVAEKGRGAFQNENGVWKKISINPISDLSQCIAVGSRHHLAPIEKEFSDSLGLKEFVSRGSSLKVMDISTGRAQMYFTTTNKIKQWDTAASYCIIHEAGGKMTDMCGEKLVYNTESINHENGLLVTNGVIHSEIIERFKKFQNKKI